MSKMESESLYWKDNIDEILLHFTDGNAKMNKAFKTGMKKGFREFESKMVRSQLTGRKNENFGLNRQSGHLAGTWSTNVQDDGGFIKGTLRSGVKYGIYHQKFPGQNRLPAPRIPKRLYVYEYFEKTGINILIQRMGREGMKALSAIWKGRGRA